MVCLLRVVCSLRLVCLLRVVCLLRRVVCLLRRILLLLLNSLTGPELFVVRGLPLGVGGRPMEHGQKGALGVCVIAAELKYITAFFRTHQTNRTHGRVHGRDTAGYKRHTNDHTAYSTSKVRSVSPHTHTHRLRANREREAAGSVGRLPCTSQRVRL